MLADGLRNPVLERLWATHRPALRPGREQLRWTADRLKAGNTRPGPRPRKEGVLELSHRGYSRWRSRGGAPEGGRAPILWARTAPEAQASGNIGLRGADIRSVRFSALRLPSAFFFFGPSGERSKQNSGAEASRERFSVSSLPGLTRQPMLGAGSLSFSASFRPPPLGIGHRVKRGGDEAGW